MEEIITCSCGNQTWHVLGGGIRCTKCRQEVNWLRLANDFLSTQKEKEAGEENSGVKKQHIHVGGTLITIKLYDAEFLIYNVHNDEIGHGAIDYPSGSDPVVEWDSNEVDFSDEQLEVIEKTLFQMATE